MLNQYGFQNAALNNEAQNNINQLAMQQAQIANAAKQAQLAADLQEAQQFNDAVNNFGQLGIAQQNANNSALAERLKLAITQQGLQNDAMSNAYALAGSLNNQNLQQQMAQNGYMYNLLNSMLGGTAITMPSGYTGAAFSGTGTGTASGSSSYSSGGLLNSLGNWLW